LSAVCFARLFLQRSRPSFLRRARSWCRHPRGNFRTGPERGTFLQRRNRADRQVQLFARLHRLDRALLQI